MNLPKEYYIAPSDLYRFGTDESSTIEIVRPIDVKLKEVNGIRFVLAVNKGISLLTYAGLKRVNRDGWVWRVVPHRLPHGLKLVQDKPDHLMICAVQDMPLDEFKGAVSKMLVHCERIFQWAKF